MKYFGFRSLNFYFSFGFKSACSFRFKMRNQDEIENKQTKTDRHQKLVGIFLASFVLFIVFSSNLVCLSINHISMLGGALTRLKPMEKNVNLIINKITNTWLRIDVD